MANLIIIAYDTEATAEAARKKLFELQKEYLIELGDAVVAVRQPDGQVTLNQLVNMTAAARARAPLVAGTRMSASMTTS